MKGDFTRGFQPDQKRGKRYRRVLLQQGRVLLDSDHAALVDATDANLREVAGDLGCKAGSPDHGFMITAGKMLRLFDDWPVGVDVIANAAVHRDYGYRFVDLTPSLFVVGTDSVAAGQITIQFADSFAGGDLAIWIRAQVGESVDDITVVGASASVDVVGTGEFERVVFTGLPETSQIQLETPPGARIWIGMIETSEDAADPGLWVAPGHYHLDGWVLENPSATTWPNQAFPSSVGFNLNPLSDYIANGVTYVIAYVEAWERLVTHHHDSGLREEALGGSLDTTVRTQLISQVKLAPGFEDIGEAPLRAGMANPIRADGMLSIIVDGPSEDPDPCAVPVEGGYTGTDNRLYRFEVHSEGDADSVVLKWSRDNGSELFPVLDFQAGEVTVATDSALRDGDLVEVLSDVVELGDVPSYPAIGGDAVIGPDGSFIPPKRQAGVLAVLVAQAPDTFGRPVFALRQVTNPSLAVSLPPAQYPDPEDLPLRLRRWHGLIDGSATEPHEIEAGIELTLTGTRFDVGDYWNYEARVLAAHDNGQWPSPAHGPERRFAPLALLQLPTTASEPVLVRGWPHDRFPSLCSLWADDIYYDGRSVCSGADTVQEALDDLYERSGCCKVVFSECHPDGVDDRILIEELIKRDLQEGGVLCLGKGTYTFESTLDIGSLGLTGELVIRGCDGTIITNGSSFEGPLVKVADGASLLIDNVILYSSSGSSPQVELSSGGILRARSCAFLHAGFAGLAIGDLLEEVQLPIPGPPMVYPTPPVLPNGGVTLELADCVVLAQTGIRGNIIKNVRIEHSAIRAFSEALSAPWIGDLHIHRSYLSGGFLIGEVPTLASLEATPLSALQIAWVIAEPTGGSAILAQMILAANISHSQMIGWNAIRVDALLNASVTKCAVTGGGAAVMVRRLYDSDIVDCRIKGNVSGFIVSFEARSSTIIGSVFAGGSSVALDVVSDDQGQPMAIEEVQIIGNRVSSAHNGIDVGPPTGTDVVRSVVIADNVVTWSGEVEASRPGIHVLRFSGEGPDVSVIGNLVRWYGDNGIRVRGYHVSVSSNHVVQRGGTSGLSVANGGPLLLRENTIDCIEGTQRGIDLLNCSDVIIQDNVVRSLAGEDLAALNLTNPGGLRVVGNDLARGQSIISNVDGAVIHSNLFHGAIQVASPSDLEFCNNHVESQVEPPNNKSLSIADGTKVTVRENTVICPAGIQTAIELVNTGDVIVKDNVVRAVDEVIALSMTNPGGTKALIRVMGNDFARGQSIVADVALVAIRNNLFHGAVLVTNAVDLVFCDNVVESWANGGLVQDACIIEGLVGGIAQINGNRVYGGGNMGALRVLPSLITIDQQEVEVEMHVQVSNNVSNILMIGYLGSNYGNPPWSLGSPYDLVRTPSVATRIQVIGNRAGYLATNDYGNQKYNIVSLNMASIYRTPMPFPVPDDTAIVSPNVALLP